MIATTEAIVMHKLDYSETSIIVHLFTHSFGRINIIVGGVKKSKSHTKSALFEPLNLLQITGNFKHLETLIRPSEIKLSQPFFRIPTDMKKRSIALFLSEIIAKTIHEPHPEPQLFQFIKTQILELENSVDTHSAFPIQFLLHYTKYLGIQPQLGPGLYFDMEEGNFTTYVPSGQYITNELRNHLHQFLETLHTSEVMPHLSLMERKNLLHALIDYYRIHLPQMKEIKSHLVLETVFS